MLGETPTRHRVSFALIGLAAAALLSSCGGDGDAAAALDEVATLEASVLDGDDAAADAATVQTEGTSDLAPDEAALEFSQCMRDGGLDFPDLSVDAEGNIELRAAFQSVDREADGFREVMDGCRELLRQTGFGGGRREALESTEVQDALLEFSACVREDGFDVGDLTLGGQGQGPGAGGDGGQSQGGEEDGGGPGQGQEGQRQQGFGNPNARFAENLGLDYEDPAVQETIDDCAIVVEEAFSSAGIGQPPTQG